MRSAASDSGWRNYLHGPQRGCTFLFLSHSSRCIRRCPHQPPRAHCDLRHVRHYQALTSPVGTTGQPAPCSHKYKSGQRNRWDLWQDGMKYLSGNIMQFSVWWNNWGVMLGRSTNHPIMSGLWVTARKFKYVKLRPKQNQTRKHREFGIEIKYLWIRSYPQAETSLQTGLRFIFTLTLGTTWPAGHQCCMFLLLSIEQMSPRF